MNPRNEGSRSFSYEGSVPPGTGSIAEECEDGVNADVFTLTLEDADADFYRRHTAALVARIDWAPTSPDAASSDLALLIQRNGQTLDSSDGGEPAESVLVKNPQSGTYRIVACAFSNAAPQPYQGKIFLNSESNAIENLASRAPSRGLRFMPGVTVDPQRDVAEPSLRIDKEGNVYACGPFGASRAADYLQKSDDGGDTFRIMGEPPEGRIAPGGGGDCDMAVAPRKNDQGNYTLSYVGLEALANFSTARSFDEGRVFEGAPTSESPILVDRQWIETTGEDEVYLFYNQIPFGGTLQRSTDGGLTYAPVDVPGNAAPSIFRPGNIEIDHNHNRNPEGNDEETLYIAYTDDNKIKVSRSADNGETFKRFTAGVGDGNPSNLFPSITIDTRGNLYVTWIEKGSFDVFYSFSRDHGETWSKKRRVNRDGAYSNTMPWIVAGSPGRIAVSFYCSPVDGNPEVGTFSGPWHVCVNQSLNALSNSPDFSQVRATHHPIHWDSICLSGLACSTNGGDRTLLDFFQMRIDPRNGRLFVVYNESNKVPRAEVGPLAIVVLSKQKSGPSLYADVGRVAPDQRKITRSASRDRRNDARFDYSSFGPPEPRRDHIPALEIQKVQLFPSRIDDRKALGVRMHLEDLSDATLAESLALMESHRLKFVVRWFSAFRPDYVVADWRPGIGFEFGRGRLIRRTTADGKLEIYPPAHEIPGNVDQERGIITMKIPYSEIGDIDMKASPAETPRHDHVRRGDKIWEVMAWTFGRPNPQDAALDYYNQADATPSFDYKFK